MSMNPDSISICIVTCNLCFCSFCTLSRLFEWFMDASTQVAESSYKFWKQNLSWLPAARVVKNYLDKEIVLFDIMFAHDCMITDLTRWLNPKLEAR